MLFRSRIREPRDVKNAGGYDILCDRDYERHKKDIKDRVTFYEHFSPPCETMTLALRQWRERSVEAPYGIGENPKVEAHNKIAVRTCSLCMIKHSVGDAFSLEHIWPTDLMRFECYKELLAMPGVIAFTFDNCAYGEKYRHRQVLIVNQPWLMALCRDCDKQHEHLTIGFDGDLKTHQVATFSVGLVNA